MATLAQQFNAISVREKDAVSLVKEYLGMPAQYVLDPTLLLNATDYEQLLLLGPVKPGHKYSCFILDMTENKRLLLDDLQKRLHCKINVIGNPDAQNSSFSYRDRQSPPVEDWLNGIEKSRLCTYRFISWYCFFLLFSINNLSVWVIRIVVIHDSNRY